MSDITRGMKSSIEAMCRAEERRPGGSGADPNWTDDTPQKWIDAFDEQSVIDDIARLKKLRKGTHARLRYEFNGAAGDPT